MRTAAIHQIARPTRPGRAFVLGALGVSLVTACVVSLGIGAYPTALDEVVAAVLGRAGLDVGSVSREVEVVVWSLRVPRMLLGVAVGAALGMAGAALQGMFRNPLADPGLIGVSAGAAVGAMLAILFSRQLFELLLPIPDAALIPLAAFGGGVATTWLVYRLGGRGTGSAATILLAGIAINAIAGAVIGVITFVADDAELRNLVMWTLGSLGAATWPQALVACGVVGLVSGLFVRQARALDALQLGVLQARASGIAVTTVHRLVVAGSAVAVAAAVAFAGLIGFVGLVAPHLVRLAIGPGHRTLLPASALLGALLLVAADMLSRTVVAPAELPIGIVTALVGGPFFLGLLVSTMRRTA